MKKLFFGFLMITSASSAFALDCSYDKLASDGGASTIQISKNNEGYYRILLSRVKGMSSKIETAEYDNAICNISKTNPLLMACKAPVQVDSFAGRISIETQLTYNALMKETLSVVVDPSETFSEVLPGFTPIIKRVSVPADSCNL
jgi:hypothetical protein